jgi:hypothetical protein
VPGLYWARKAFVNANGLPVIDGLSATVNLFVTLNYQSCQHVDLDLEFGYAFGIWFEEHEEHCKRAAKGKSCFKHWFLCFSAYQIKVRLRDGIVLAWNRYTILAFSYL